MIYMYIWVFVFLARQDCRKEGKWDPNETYPETHPETHPETYPQTYPRNIPAKHTRETYPRNIPQNQSDVDSNDAGGSNGVVK